MLRMFINSLVEQDGTYLSTRQFEVDLQEIREKGVCAFNPDTPGATYTIGISNIWGPAERFKLDYDAIISTPSLCTLFWQYMVESTADRSRYPTERSEIEAFVDGRASSFPTFRRYDFWTLKHVALISSVDEVKESEVFLVNFDLIPDYSRQIYMVGWASD